MKKRIILIAFIVLLVGVSSLVFYAQRRSKESEMSYSGTIEATSSNLAFQVAGHVSTVPAVEGKSVKKGQVLAELDSAEFSARLDQARANLDKAVTGKEQLDSMLQIYSDTLPAEVKRAQSNIEIAENTMVDAQRNARRYEELYKRGVVSEKERDSVRLNFDNAQSMHSEAKAVLNQAKGNLAKIDATKKDIESAQAQIDLARAALDQARIQLGYTRLSAPFSGTIISRNVEPGEVVNPGREVFTLSDLSEVDLKIFVDETDIGKVKTGQKVKVVVDSFPGKFFTGRVSYISPEAEFTPKIIQTKKERVKLVYLTKVTIPNPRLELKTGMPADAYLE